jgi:predicted flap endonuclease-1-like 5' DNA nuclease
MPDHAAAPGRPEEVAVRSASRVVRLTALLAVALSVGWLLLRRHVRPAPALRVVPDGPPWPPPPRTPVDPTVLEPRAPEPVDAIGRPVHDAAEAEAAEARAAEARAAEAGAAEAGAAEAGAAEAGAAEAGAAGVGAAGVGPAETLPAPAAVPDALPAEERTDDLRRIRGVGPTIESALHGLGVRSYRQLATLDEDGLERVRDAVRDRWQRIEREDWIGQARQLHQEKYGEEV